MIDQNGFRLNVGIILMNAEGRLLWARRAGQDAWQFPQGGVNDNENTQEALYRELHEEVGLNPNDVKIIAKTKNWLKYRLPPRLIRNETQPLCIGQKQKWFLLKLLAKDSLIDLKASPCPEFDDWKWVSYWFPLHQVVDFKRDVYRQALNEFSNRLWGVASDHNNLKPINL